MSLETQVQNLASEAGRRWKAIRGRPDDEHRRAMRDLLAKLAFGTWLLAGNLLRAAVGSRVHRQVLAIRRLQMQLRESDEEQVLALLRHAVDTVLWQVAVARRDGVGLRRVERLVAEFVDAADADLVKLSRMAKG